MLVRKIPNILTTMRILFIPIICGLMYVDTAVTRVIAIFFAILACVTDFFDGKIARKYEICSSYGKCMDPIADKTLIMSLMVMLVYLEKAWVFPCIVILFRDFAISGIREYVSLERSMTIDVSKLSKLKTATQMFALLFLMCVGSNVVLLIIGNILLVITAILSLITSWQYVKSVENVIF